MDIKARLQEDMKNAMREKQKEKLLVIRLMLAAVKQIEIDKRVILSDAEVIAILDKMLKQRRESIVQYEQGNRHDLADQEKYEIGLIQTYMPQVLTEAEVDQFIQEALIATEAKTPQDMGKIMGVLKPKLQGRTDMTQVSHKIKQQLN
jgi:uncharacterized protein YqeY